MTNGIESKSKASNNKIDAKLTALPSINRPDKDAAIRLVLALMDEHGKDAYHYGDLPAPRDEER